MRATDPMHLRLGPLLMACRLRVDFLVVTTLLSMLACVTLHSPRQLLLLLSNKILMHDLALHLLGSLVRG